MHATINQSKTNKIDELNSHRLISIADVRTLFGGVSDMTIWRWLQDETLNFPKPVYVQRRRFWHEVKLLEWIADRPTNLEAPK